MELVFRLTIVISGLYLYLHRANTTNTTNTGGSNRGRACCYDDIKKKKERRHSMSKKPPVLHYEKMLYNGSFSPSTIHTKNNTMFCYFVEYLLQKAISVFEFNGMPETWDKGYFLYNLFTIGWIAVIKTDRYGVIPQRCTLSGLNIYNLPNKVIVTNGLLPEVNELTIDEDCCLLKLMPDYHNMS